MTVIYLIFKVSNWNALTIMATWGPPIITEGPENQTHHWNFMAHHDQRLTLHPNVHTIHPICPK